MTNNNTLLNEEYDDESLYPLSDYDTELKQIEKLKVLLQNKTNSARDEHIKNLQNGMGAEIRNVLKNPDEYALKPIKKPFSTKIKEFFNKLFKVL